MTTPKRCDEARRHTANVTRSVWQRKLQAVRVGLWVTMRKLAWVGHDCQAAIQAAILATQTRHFIGFREPDTLFDVAQTGHSIGFLSTKYQIVPGARHSPRVSGAEVNGSKTSCRRSCMPWLGTFMRPVE